MQMSVKMLQFDLSCANYLRIWQLYLFILYQHHCNKDMRLHYESALPFYIP